jgi:hypothetical protein
MPRDGAVQALFAPSGPAHEVTDLAANCDGSFAATGLFRKQLAFDGRAGATLSATGADTPLNPIWVAGFDAGGSARFLRGIVLGVADGSGIWPHLAAFPDGSVTIGGTFGTSATFGEGEPNQTELTAMSNHPEGYIAHFADDGEFQWVKHFGPGLDNYVSAVAPGLDGVTYAFLTSLHGHVVGPGELDLMLGQGEGALVSLSRSGHFVHGVRFSSKVNPDLRLTPLSDGGVAMLASFTDGAVLAVGTAQEATLATSTTALLHARFSSTLELGAVHSKLPIAGPRSSALLADGSVIVAVPGATTDAELARYAADGSQSWSTPIASSTEITLFPVAALADGSSWAVVSFAEPVAPVSAQLVVAPGTPHELMLEPSGSAGFVLRFSPSGEPLWAVPLEATELLQVTAAAGAAGSLIFGGKFTGTLSFGGMAKSLIGATDAGRASAFLAELGP